MYRSRVKWSNPGKGVAPCPTPWCSSYQKEAFGSPSTTVANFTTCFISFNWAITLQKQIKTFVVQKVEGTVDHSTVTRMNFVRVGRTFTIKQGQVGLKS